MSTQILICTDLDRTLLPNGKQPESHNAREIFARLVARPEVTLAYVSGRHRELVTDAIDEYNLPLPDWVIGDVGTTIYQVNSDDWLHWHAWEQDISTDWQGLMSRDLRPIFTDISELRLQEEAKQNHYKLSYYVPLEVNSEALQIEMDKRLNAHNIAASLIYSIDEAAATGLLDVLPARATKLHAVEFLMQHQNFDYSNTIYAGDSGNDLPVLISNVQSVLVANASSEVAEQSENLARQQGTISTLYLAKGGFLGMNGNYSAGILEGVAHYFSFTVPWMQ